MERSPAVKVRIKDLVEGEFYRTPGNDPNYLLTSLGEKVSRARVLGVVVSKFVSEDGEYVNITLDDGTATISVRAFRDTRVLEKIDVGDTAEIIGKVKEYEGEVYLLAEIARKISDPNWELVRRLELVIKEKKLGKSRERAVLESAGESEEDPKERVLEVIKRLDQGEGVKYISIVRELGMSEDQLDAIINELLLEGEIYEPKIGRFKITGS